MRLINADALNVDIALIAKEKAKSDAQKALMGRLMFVVENYPTIDAKPVKHGYWIEMNDCIVCSNCNHAILDDFYEKRYKYIVCPYCGAKMDGESE